MSLFGINTCDACTSCRDCGHPWCRDEEVSPGEDRGLCATCALLAERLSGWGA